MSKKLRDLLHDAKEAEAVPPLAAARSLAPAGGSSSVDGDLTEQEILSNKEFMSAEPPVTSKNDSSVHEDIAADTLLEFQLGITPVDKKSSTEFTVIRMSNNAIESEEQDDSVHFEAEKPSDSLINGEIMKPERAKKTVRLQSNQNKVSDNVTVPKAAVLKPCPSVGTNLESFDLALRSIIGGYQEDGESNGAATMEEAWERLKKSYVYFKGKPVGTLAAMDPNAEALNYNQVNLSIDYFVSVEMIYIKST